MAIDQNINKIKFLRSKTAGLVPSPSLFDEGELAINLVDRTIFSKNGTAVVELGFGKGGNVNGAISATGNITAPTFIGKLQGNADTASKWDTSRTLTLAGDVSGNVTFDGSANFTLNAIVGTVNPRQNVMNSDDAPGNMRHGLSIDWVGNTSGFPNYGTVITAKAYAAGGSTFQIYSPYSPSLGGDSLRYRTGIYSAVVSWSELKTIVDNNNIGRYAPSLTGVGASGNWNIDVEGYATKLKTPVTINGTSFDGTSGIVIADPTFTRPLSHGSTIVTNTTDIASTGGVAFRFASTSTSSKPAGVTDGPILSMAYSGAWNFQLMGDHRTGVMYTRPKNNGTWGSWKTTLNNENIGDHALPITGGTLNGNLIVNGDVRSTGIIGSDSTKGFGTGNNRSIKPVDLTARTFAVNFVSLKGLNDPTIDAIYGDFISFNTWSGSSGGKLNGLFLTKGAQRIKHYQAAFDATVWGDPLDIAYLTDNVASATKLETTRTIGISGSSGASGTVSFDGTGNALIPLSVTTQPTATNNTTIATTAFVQAVNSADTGSAATALTLKTARLVGITGSGASGSVSFNGSSNVNIPLVVATQPTATNDTTIATTAFVQAVNSADTGSAATALTLKTARTINGTSFNGSANITTANWGTARNFTIGSTTRSVNGASNLSWTLTDIGALGVSANAVSASKLQTPRKVNGVDFDGTTDIQIDAIRVGTITWHLGERSSIFAGDLSLDGQILNRADYPELWSMVNAGRFASVTDAVWLSDVSKRGSYSTGNGSTTFRLPDLNGGQAGSIQSLFLRGSSTTPVGTVLSDAIRNITGSVDAIRMGINWTPKSTGALKGTPSTNSGDANNGASATMVLDIDASRVVPTADENRPKSVFGIWVVSARGSNVVVPGGSTAATLTGGNTFQGSQTINGDLVVKQNVKVEGITTDRFGFYDKMYWAGAISRPNAQNVLVTPLDGNRFTAYFTLNSGSQYINFGTSKIHMIQNWDSPTPKYIQATIDSSVDANAGKQVITLTCTLPNHGIAAATNFFWIAITYESFGCEIDQYIANGDLRFVSRLKSDSAFVSKSPIVSISSSSSEWYSATQSGTGKPEIGPGATSSAPIVAAVSGQHIAFVGVGGIQVPYVTISVKDRIT